MNYELFRIITIGIIIICLLAIIFKKQLKQLFTEGFVTNEPSTTTTTTTTSGVTATTSGATATTSGVTATTSGGTATTSGATATTSGATAVTTTARSELDELPAPTTKPDVMDIKYMFRVAGYVPVLDIILTRLILLKIWEADWANLNTTQLTALNGIPDSAQPTTSETFVDNEISSMNTNKRSTQQLYPETYGGDFEAFFTAEISNIPRLNVFIPNTNTNTNTNDESTNLYMDIVFTNFSKPEWVTRMAQYYKDPTTVTQTVEDYVSELKGELPQRREGNTSNTYSAREISDLKSLIIPIELREKIEKLQLNELLINLVPGAEPASVSQQAPQFNEMTHGLLTYISSYYPTLNMLYIRVDDDDTQVLLGLTKDAVHTTDDLIKPTLVSDKRSAGSWTLANMLGYPDPNGIKYITRIQFNDNRSATDISDMLAFHTKQIKQLARKALLQNSAFGTYIPDKLINGHDGVETVTDNIYTYYFNILKQNQPLICRMQKVPECFDNMKREKIFLALDEGGHLNKIYPDLANLKEDAALLTDEYNNAVTTGLPEPDQKKIKVKLDDTNRKVNVLTRKIPYAIYLSIYDFQFIKIIPKRIKGDMFKPDPVKNF